MSLRPDPAAAPAAPVTAVRGVGEERARLLDRLGIRSVEDLLLHAPRRYEDRRKFLAIRELRLKEAATVRGRIVAAGVKSFRRGARSLFECVLDDGTGRLHCRWWQAQPWMPEWYAVGREFLVFGRPGALKPRQMDHPETELVEPGDEEFIHVNRIVPVHPLTEGLTARVLRALVWHALDQFEATLAEPAIRPDARRFPTRAHAARLLHFPESLADAELARQRLAMDEFITLQARILERRRRFEARARALPCGGNNQWIKPFLARLGFALTGSQTRVLREIRAGLSGPHPMRRLLQGDVGSGKTVVAACASLMTLESGYNAALMAPTEILAEQHHRNFTAWLEPLGIHTRLLTSGAKTTAAPDAVPTLTIGTHALLSRGLDLPRLGLVIIDEQHKFGVAQREALLRKGHYPHLLVLTATPIPRTLGLTLYGDLDLSVMDQSPAGRGTVKTFIRTPDKLPAVFDFLRQQLKAGRQAYVVYPRVEAADAADASALEPELKAVTREYQRLVQALAPFKVGLLHGRLKAGEKEPVMTAFWRRELDVLVATSLIEVGVDVPNATVMLVENAEHFGLAQLHQLRGRIGRGAHQSFCILISGARNPEALARLNLLETSRDGFAIAEADLRLRGPGELLGRQQSGLPDLKFGNLVTDLNLIREARQLVNEASPPPPLTTPDTATPAPPA